MTGRTRRAMSSTAYEPADISARPILVTVVAVLLVLAGVLALLSPWRHGVTVTPPPAPAGAALLPDPAAALARFRAAKAARLEGYGWIDEPAGVARIPVERAIALLLAQHTAPGNARETGQ